MGKLVAVAYKDTGTKIRIGTLAAAVMVENEEAYYIKKGAFKRQQRDSAKVRAKRKAIFGAKIIRDYEAKKQKPEND